jgi:hypothetical protein
MLREEHSERQDRLRLIPGDEERKAAQALQDELAKS